MVDSSHFGLQVGIRELLAFGINPKTHSTNCTPEGWQICSLGSICELSSGNGFTPREWATHGLPIIRIQNLNGSKDFNYFAGEPDPKWIVEPGELLFAWAGVKGVSFGPCIWPGPRGVLNQHIYRIKPAEGVNQVWLYETLKMLTSKIEDRAHGFKLELVHAKKGEITGQMIALPQPEEQLDIAKQSTALSTMKTDCLMQLELTIQMKRLLMQEFLMEPFDVQRSKQR